MEPGSGVRFGHVDGVVLNENVSPATHGETATDETLGGADHASLDVRIDRGQIAFALSIGAETHGRRVLAASIEPDGSPQLLFGDGAQGRRPPDGTSLRTTYGYGAGVRGNVGSGAITTILSRPMALEAVANPTSASAGADPEEVDDIRRNAPTATRASAFDRAVSLKDFADIARSHAGVARAAAPSTWSTHEACTYTFMGLVTGSRGTRIDGAEVTAIGIAANPPATNDQVLTFDVTVFVGVFRRALASAKWLRSEEESTSLRDLLSVVAGELQLLADEIEELWDDAFVGAKTTWAVPYIGVLIEDPRTAVGGGD